MTGQCYCLNCYVSDDCQMFSTTLYSWHQPNRMHLKRSPTLMCNRVSLLQIHDYCNSSLSKTNLHLFSRQRNRNLLFRGFCLWCITKLSKRTLRETSNNREEFSNCLNNVVGYPILERYCHRFEHDSWSSITAWKSQKNVIDIRAVNH